VGNIRERGGGVRNGSNGYTGIIIATLKGTVLVRTSYIFWFYFKDEIRYGIQPILA
jgi:hypothetical protein